MKNSLKIRLLALTCAALSVFAASCGSTQESSSQAETTVSSAAETTAETTAEETSVEESTAESSSEAESSATEVTGNLWKNAQYTKDTEVGQGKITVQVEVAAEDQKITFTIHTDKDNLGAALTENKLVEGDNTEYGLYITAVNGMTADYDKDKAYWAISKDGKYLDTGADSTKIADGEHYELTYTKG